MRNFKSIIIEEYENKCESNQDQEVMKVRNCNKLQFNEGRNQHVEEMKKQIKEKAKEAALKMVQNESQEDIMFL